MNTLALVLAAVIVVGLGILYVLLREQGPNPVMVLLGRHTPLPFALLALAPVVLLGLWRAPTKTIVALLAVLWFAIIGGLLAGWNLGTVSRGVRRIRIRCMWPSVARSAGLGVRNDRRSKSWPGGVSMTITSAETIEHLPRIWHGRALANGAGVSYRLRPAKGATIDKVTGEKMALAAALGVQSISVPNPKRPNRGELVVLYGDVLTGRR